MQIVEKKLAELREYENNPRNNDNAVAAVAESIKEFGFKVPIVIDAAGVIIAGHTRAKAAARLGLQTVPCIVADDLTDEQICAYRLADNKTGELANWDFAKLEYELSELSAIEFDMTAFGFDAESLLEISMEELDRNEEEKEDVAQITVKFSLRDWRCIETEFKSLIETNNGKMAVKMI